MKLNITRMILSFRENMVELMKRINSLEPSNFEDYIGRCDKLMKCDKYDYNCNKKRRGENSERDAFARP